MYSNNKDWTRFLERPTVFGAGKFLSSISYRTNIERWDGGTIPFILKVYTVHCTYMLGADSCVHTRH